jgi:flagellar M-ring protein FliF
MGEQLQKVLKSFRQFWDAQSRKRKITYIIIVAAIILIAVIIAALLNRRAYFTLYTGLEPEEASIIYNEIQNLGYEVELRSGGTIEVISGTEGAIAMDMAVLNYPSKSDYSDYIDTTGMFSTESDKRFYSVMTAESKIKTAIESINGVDSANVILSVPQQRNVVVSSNREYPTAAITVNLKRNAELTGKQITGIYKLVSMAHSGLTEDRVTIINGDGVLLLPGETSADRFTDISRQIYIETQLETSATNKILDLLGPGYGDDLAVVVDYALNFDRVVSETVDYGEGSLQHEYGTDATGGTTVDGGVAGVENNVEENPTVVPADGNGAWSESEFERNWLVDTDKAQRQKEGYNIDGLTASIILYSDYVPASIIENIVRIAATAIGVRPYDDDGNLIADNLITVINHAKYGDLSGEPVVLRGLFGLTTAQLLLAAAVLAVLLVVLFVALAISSRSANKKRMLFEQRLMETMALEDLDRQALSDGFLVDLDGEPIDVPSLTDDSAETKELVIRREIGEFARTSPDIVATLLKNWLKAE